MRFINDIRFKRWALALFTGSVLATGCTDPVDLDLPEATPVLVVDGWIHNTNEVPNQVRLTMTSDYFDNTEPPPVSGATVRLYEDGELVETLEESATDKGLYPITSPGVMGRTYYIEIVVPGGETYRSLPETINRISEITDIYFQYEDGPLITEGYYVYINTYEPEGLGDFYRWKHFVDGDYQSEPFDLTYAEDDLVDGNTIEDLDLVPPIVFATSEEAKYNESGVAIDPETDLRLFGNVIIDHDSAYIRVEQSSISRNAFEFFQVLNEQTAFIGGLFDPPPSPIRGNIVQADDPDAYALGFFGASAVSSAEIWVTDTENMLGN